MRIAERSVALKRTRQGTAADRKVAVLTLCHTKLINTDVGRVSRVSVQFNSIKRNVGEPVAAEVHTVAVASEQQGESAPVAVPCQKRWLEC